MEALDDLLSESDGEKCLSPGVRFQDICGVQLGSAGRDLGDYDVFDDVNSFGGFGGGRSGGGRVAPGALPETPGDSSLQDVSGFRGLPGRYAEQALGSPGKPSTFGSGDPQPSGDVRSGGVDASGNGRGRVGGLHGNVRVDTYNDYPYGNSEDDDEVGAFREDDNLGEYEDDEEYFLEAMQYRGTSRFGEIKEQARKMLGEFQAFGGDLGKPYDDEEEDDEENEKENGKEGQEKSQLDKKDKDRASPSRPGFNSSALDDASEGDDDFGVDELAKEDQFVGGGPLATAAAALLRTTPSAQTTVDDGSSASSEADGTSPRSSAREGSFRGGGTGSSAGLGGSVGSLAAELRRTSVEGELCAHSSLVTNSVAERQWCTDSSGSAERAVVGGRSPEGFRGGGGNSGSVAASPSGCEPRSETLGEEQAIRSAGRYPLDTASLPPAIAQDAAAVPPPGPNPTSGGSNTTSGTTSATSGNAAARSGSKTFLKKGARMPRSNASISTKPIACPPARKPLRLVARAASEPAAARGGVGGAGVGGAGVGGDAVGVTVLAPPAPSRCSGKPPVNESSSAEAQPANPAVKPPLVGANKSCGGGDFENDDWDDTTPWDCRGADLDFDYGLGLEAHKAGGPAMPATPLDQRSAAVPALSGEPPTSRVVKSYFRQVATPSPEQASEKSPPSRTHGSEASGRHTQWEGNDAYATLYGAASGVEGGGRRKQEQRLSPIEQPVVADYGVAKLEQEARHQINILDQKVKKYEQETEVLKKLQAQAEQAERDIARDREKLRREVEAEKRALHAEFDAERAAMKRERRRLSQGAERQRQILAEDREAAEERRKLRERNEQLEEEMKEKDKRSQRTVDRLQRQVAELTKKNHELQEEMKEKDKRSQRTVDRLQRQVAELTKKNHELQEEVKRANMAQQLMQASPPAALTEARRGSSSSARGRRSNSTTAVYKGTGAPAARPQGTGFSGFTSNQEAWSATSPTTFAGVIAAATSSTSSPMMADVGPSGYLQGVEASSKSRATLTPGIPIAASGTLGTRSTIGLVSSPIVGGGCQSSPAGSSSGSTAGSSQRADVGANGAFGASLGLAHGRMGNDSDKGRTDPASEEVVDVKTLDGRTETIFRDGRREVTFANGLRKVIWADGRTSVLFQNGDRKEIHRDGVVVYHYNATGAVQTTLPDGEELYHFADGQFERHAPDGSKEIRFPNGTSKRIFLDGAEEVNFADGSTRTTPAPAKRAEKAS
eukprot:TRINITY_DN10061_c0_g1_i1.p1 TRINITY_DN10061_c0_g1~~TRINITY_DN10061_c0_g1_i1.p1  ORF type:complete len:1237 (-),score=295.07 TRINITY_DN10061_c0_g1_i1:170-3880(-)